MSLKHSLDQYVQLVQGHPTLPPELVTRGVELRERLASGQLHLAVLGQFKRGKSTLINALLGAEILPDGVLPVTLVPVFLRFGSRPDLQVHYANARGSEGGPLDSLRDFVAEASNPQNNKNVSHVDVFYPAPLLQGGIVLIDTPGVGSTQQHNTDTTLDFLPRCDAGILVLSTDPPITAAEVTFLEQLRPHVAQLFFVLNKIDYLDEGSIVEAEHFLRETLQTSLGMEVPHIFALSARQGLRARLKGDTRELELSGIPQLERALLAFGASSKQTVLSRAIQRKAANLVNEADQFLALEQRALQLPLEALEQRMAAFSAYADASRRQRREIGDGLVGDEKRLREQLETAVGGLRERALVEMDRQAEDCGMPTHDREHSDRFHRAARRFFDEEREALSRLFRRQMTDVLTERTEAVRGVREDLRREAARLLDIPHFPLEAEETMVELAGPTWALEHLSARQRPSFSERLLPQSLRQKHQARRRQELVRELVVRNVEKVRWWGLQTVQESVRRFRQEMEAEMEETIQQIERALQAGRDQHASQAGSQRATEAAIAGQRARLGQIRHAIEHQHADRPQGREIPA